MEASMQATIIPAPHGKPVQVRLHRQLFDAIESWRRGQSAISSRPEAIRQLLLRSLIVEASDQTPTAT
jgi:hypothetical protein